MIDNDAFIYSLKFKTQNIQPIRRIRVIPTLLTDSRSRLVKTVKFGKRTYIGDPINAMKIFNTKEVDELILLDIDATADGRRPNFDVIEDIASEAFMPLGYGGGIHSIDDIERLYQCGIEKVILSSCVAERPELIEQAASRFGTQAVVVCLQVKKKLLGDYKIRRRSGSNKLGETPEIAAKNAVESGAGELIVYDMDRDGSYQGYNLDLLRRVSTSVNIPVVACGGARNIDDFKTAVLEGRCSAVAAGSMFVYQSEKRGVLISYPSQAELTHSLFEQVV